MTVSIVRSASADKHREQNGDSVGRNFASRAICTFWSYFQNLSVQEGDALHTECAASIDRTLEFTLHKITE